MTDRPFDHLAKDLSGDLPRPAWPAGIRPATFDAARHLAAAHDLLVDSYRHGGGRVGARADWWSAVGQDPEYDPALFFVALDDHDRVVGLAQCWTSGFLKDLAVAGPWRRRGLGEALLRHVFLAFRARGRTQVELKVERDNPSGAGRLYRRLGMEPLAPPVHPARPGHVSDARKGTEMPNPDEDDLDPIGSEGAQIKRKIRDDKADEKTEAFDPGMSMLGTDNEAGAMPDPDGMAEARKAPKP